MWAHDYTRHSEWWPPAPPPHPVILEEMRSKALAKIPTGPLISDPAIMVRQERRYAEFAATVLDRGGSSMHARAAVRMEMDRTFAINRSNEVFDDPIYAP